MTPVSDILVRDVRLDDAAAIVSILNPIIESGEYTALDTRLTADFERDYIAGYPQRGIFHVAVQRASGRVVGLQDVSPYADYTHAFDHVGVIGTFVDLAERRQGIGGLLFAATLQAARRKGYEKFFTSVRADNPDALAFYMRMGFRLLGTAERQAKISGRYIDEIMIERFL